MTYIICTPVIIKSDDDEINRGFQTSYSLLK